MTVARMIISGERRATPMMLPSLLISILYQDLIPQDSRWVRMSRKKKTDKSLVVNDEIGWRSILSFETLNLE